MGLTVKREKFCQLYVELGDGTKAYERAGFKCSTRNVARVEASKLLTIPKVSARIKELMDEIKSNNIASAEEVLAYLTSVMRGELKDEVVNIYDGAVRRARKDVDARDKNKAAELLGKRYRLFVDRIEAEVDTEIVVKMDDQSADWSK